MPNRAPVEIKRHYHTLSEQETADVVDAVAELIVNFMKGKRDSKQAVGPRQEQTHEQNVSQQLESR